jgi:hypothetical protein
MQEQKMLQELRVGSCQTYLALRASCHCSKDVRLSADALTSPRVLWMSMLTERRFGLD